VGKRITRTQVNNSTGISTYKQPQEIYKMKSRFPVKFIPN
jgi:hypothetical protein